MVSTTTLSKPLLKTLLLIWEYYVFQ